MAKEPTDDRPFSPHGIVHAERVDFYARHTERRIQKLYCGHYKPSEALEAKRLHKLKPVKTNSLLTRDYLARASGEVRLAQRAELDHLTAEYLANHNLVRVTNQMPVARTRGRPPIGDRAMTSAERVRRHRAKFTTPAPHGRHETGAVRPLPLGRTASVNLLRKRR
jgi:hypothetical protein